MYTYYVNKLNSKILQYFGTRKDYRFCIVNVIQYLKFVQNYLTEALHIKLPSYLIPHQFVRHFQFRFECPF